MKKFSRLLISKRTIIQVAIAVVLYYIFTTYHLSLWWLLLVGVTVGLVFGKVFCRWMCPLGFLMETMMGMSPDNKLSQMYQYHKVGCPIAWVQGFLNRMSYLKIRLNTDTCKSCGICDKQCYIATLEPTKYSLYKPDLQRPGQSFSCSKCLSCVTVCKNGSLKYSFKK